MKGNQCDKILAYMREYGGITQREAYRLGCARLAARIHDIKRKYPVDIETEPVTVRDMDGSYSTIARYTIREEE